MTKKIYHLLLSSVVVYCGFTFAQGPQRPLSAPDIARRSFPSVVVLFTEDIRGKPVSLGSGFFVRPDVVATNYHVIKHAARIFSKTVGQDTVYEIAGLVGTSEKDDLALLKLKRVSFLDQLGTPSPSLPLADGSRITVGDPVFVVGNPEGLEGTFSQGIVSALRQDYVQITAPISHGSSGGPVLNKYGEVIGVAAGAIEAGQNLNFAIPVTRLRTLMNLSSSSVTPLAPRTDATEIVSAAPKKPEATREETGLWLKNKLEGVVTYSSTSSSDGYRSRIERLDFQSLGGCNMDLTIASEIASTRFVHKYSPVLALAEIASSGRNKDGDWAVWISFTRAIYQFNEVYDRGRLIKKDEEKTNSVALFTGDEELANRAANALNHLIKLCGGGAKKEPF